MYLRALLALPFRPTILAFFGEVPQMKRVLTLVLVLSLSAFAQGKGKGHNKHNEDNDDRSSAYGKYVLDARQRTAIGNCLNDPKAGLPPGLAKRDRLPPGLERQLQRNGTLPPGLQKKVQALPSQCQVNLPRLPGGWERVVLGDRVIVLDPAKRIIDWANIALGRPRER
jgi:hypothetical protein